MSTFNVKKRFSRGAAKIGVLTFASVVFVPPMANAQDADRTPQGFIETAKEGGNEICQPLDEYKGITINALTSANIHSRNNIGTLAIAVRPGSDVYDTPAQLTTLFRNNGVKTDCFINDIPLKKGGTIFTFYVDGVPVDYEGQTSFGIQELRNNPDILRAVKAYSIMAESLLTDKYRAKPE